jgi:hypothetical protein
LTLSGQASVRSAHGQAALNSARQSVKLLLMKTIAPPKSREVSVQALDTSHVDALRHIASVCTARSGSRQ